MTERHIQQITLSTGQWCAARLTEHAECIDAQILMMLGDFERCLARAWLERR